MYLKNNKNNELMREALEWMMISRCQTQTQRVGDRRSRDGQAWTMAAALPLVKRDHLLCALQDKDNIWLLLEPIPNFLLIL
jgi:hypothetical protein